MPAIPDYLLVAYYAVFGPLWFVLVDWPRHVRRVEAGEPGARVRLYRRAVIEQWLLAAGIGFLWLAAGRPAGTLGLHLPGGWRLALGLALPAAYVALMVFQIPALARSAEARAQVRATLVPLEAALPHRAGEWGWFKAVSVTAGVCEELLFRGHLVWVLTPWLGLYGAAGASLLVFGLAHAYQGKAGALKALAAGACMAGLALLTGSLVPGILLHAFVDLGSGYASYLVLRDQGQGVRPAPFNALSTSASVDRISQVSSSVASPSVSSDLTNS